MRSERGRDTGIEIDFLMDETEAIDSSEDV